MFSIIGQCFSDSRIFVILALLLFIIRRLYFTLIARQSLLFFNRPGIEARAMYINTIVIAYLLEQASTPCIDKAMIW